MRKTDGQHLHLASETEHLRDAVPTMTVGTMFLRSKGISAPHACGLHRLLAFAAQQVERRRRASTPATIDFTVARRQAQGTALNLRIPVCRLRTPNGAVRGARRAQPGNG